MMMRKLKDVMTSNVEVIRPDATLREAAEKMRRWDTGVLPVCDADRIKGMITDRDIVVRGLAEGRDAMETRVSEVMTPEVMYCYEDESVAEAARLMAKRQIRRLVVLNRQKRLVGIVSIGDLATETPHDKMLGKTLEKVSSSSGWLSRGSSSQDLDFSAPGIPSFMSTIFGAVAVMGGYYLYTNRNQLFSWMQQSSQPSNETESTGMRTSRPESASIKPGNKSQAV